MGVTKVNELKAPQSRAYIGVNLPTTPTQYYGIGTGIGHVDSVEWRGGEIAFLTTDLRMYVQSSTSGTTPMWRRYLTAFVAA